MVTKGFSEVTCECSQAQTMGLALLTTHLQSTHLAPQAGVRRAQFSWRPPSCRPRLVSTSSPVKWSTHWSSAAPSLTSKDKINLNQSCRCCGAVVSPEWEPERPTDHPRVVLPGGRVTGGRQGPAQQLLQPSLQLELVTKLL